MNAPTTAASGTPRRPAPAVGRLRAFFAAVYPCRFALLSVALNAVALLLVPQIAECLRALAESAAAPASAALRWMMLHLAALCWAGTAWYWTRQLLNFRTPAEHAETATFRLVQTYLPRLIGAAALAVLALGLRRAARGYGAVADGGFAAALDRQALLAAALSAGFYLLVHFRRPLFRLGPAVTVRRVRELPRTTLIALALTVAVNLLLLLAFWIAPVATGWRLGTVTILLIAAAGWCTTGSAAVLLDSRFGVPVIPIALVLVVLFSLWNDNHALRDSGVAAPPAPTLDAYADAWLEARAPALAGPQPYPVLVVATAGGGIRAAYWTGSLLAALQDRYGAAFSDHIFAISGVSGGSLGAATYVALLDPDPAVGARLRCADGAGRSLRACAAAVLGQDFLAPVVGAMLFPDLVQRFWPRPVLGWDRGRALEASWERAWTARGLPDLMAQPFYGLWSGGAAAVHRPLLFLNSTLVESGERVIVTPLRLPRPDAFSGALELTTLTAVNPPLSAAAHLSARFTYVSPAASIHDGAGQLVGHLVDGGYFENSGADTAAGIVNALHAAAERRAPAATLDIRVILITNEPGERAATVHKLPAAGRWLTELLAPPTALLEAREARGWEAESAVRLLVPGRNGVLPLGLAKSSIKLPLGWTLSDLARDEIDRQLAVALAAPTRPRAIRELDALLGGEAVAAGATATDR
jgi:hypothetical protein